MYQTGSTNSNKDSVVATARQAREERALKKKKECAAITIQSSVRGFLQRLSLGKSWRGQLDELIGWSDEEELQAKAKLQSRIAAKKAQKQASLTSDKISHPSQQLDPEEWKFASFSSNTLTGAYGNLSGSKPVITVSNPSDNDTSSAAQSIGRSATFPNDKTSASVSINSLISEKSEDDTTAIKANVTNVEIFKVIQRFLFVFKSDCDRNRFLKMCKYLLQNVDNEKSIKNSFAALAVHKQLVKAWIVQIKNILWTCCKYLDKVQYNKDAEALPIYLRMLITFTNISNWRALKKQVALHPVLTQLCGNVARQLADRGCMCILGTMLAKSNLAAFSASTLQASLTVIVRLLAANEFGDDAIIVFVDSILSVPALFWHMQAKASQVLSSFAETVALSRIIALLRAEGACAKRGIAPAEAKSADVIRVLCTLANLLQLLVIEEKLLKAEAVHVVALFNQLLKCLFENTTRTNASSSTWHVVLGYFSGNRTKNSESMQLVKSQLRLLWDPTFVRAIYHDVLTLPSLHDDKAVPTQAEQISSRSKGKVKLSNKLSSILKRMASNRPQKVLLPTGGRQLEYAEVRNTCGACLLYKRALSVFTKQLQLEMLTGLMFMDEVLCRLWRFICELGPSGGLELFLSSLTLPRDVAEPYFAVFTLFCDMTAHVLSILDDVEFYDQQVPFHLEELVTVSAFLRQFVFKVIWGQIVKDSNSAMFPVFDSAYTLLMMLYDRDARRTFTPKDHWLCKDVKASSVRNEVEKGYHRAKLILEKIPFVIPHKDRVLLFNSFVAADKNALGIFSNSESSIHIKVRRSRLVEDGFDFLSSVSSNSLKGVIRVKFFNDLGLDEAGIDQDGVFKEFLEEIIKKVFNPDMNLFKVTDAGEPRLYPSPLSHLQDNHLNLFAFIGRMLGKAVYEGIVLDIPFANFFLRSLLGQQHTMLYSPIDELPSLDVEFYNNLTWIKRYEGDIADLGLTFTYEEDVMGKVESHDLIPGGSAIPVNNENRIMYIHTLAHYRMHTQIQQQTRAFVAGFRSIIAPVWTNMFSAPELQRLVSGDNVDMDLTDLKKNVVYYGGFHSSHRVVRWLWDILERDYTPSQRAAFLKFVTSCSKPPLLGFAQLQPQFSIRCVEVPDEEDTGDTVATVLRGFFRLTTAKGSSSGSPKYPHRLPTASTCFNLLKLPNYPNKDVLREKLKQAIANNTGFELS